MQTNHTQPHCSSRECLTQLAKPPTLLSVNMPGPRADSLPDLEDVLSNHTATYVLNSARFAVYAESTLTDRNASLLTKEVSLQLILSSKGHTARAKMLRCTRASRTRSMRVETPHVHESVSIQTELKVIR